MLKRELAYKGVGDSSIAKVVDTGLSKDGDFSKRDFSGPVPSVPGDIRPLVAVLERIERSINEGIAFERSRVGPGGGAPQSA